MKSKQLYLSLILVSLFSSVPSFALVAMKAECSTADGQLQVNVTDNQGIGRVRTSHLSASVRDTAGNVVANYAVTYDKPSIESASFGTATFRDTETSGRKFTLTTGSTNSGPTLRALLTDGTIVQDGKVSCQFFGL